MDKYYGFTDQRASSGGTRSSCGSESPMMDPSSLRRPRFSLPDDPWNFYVGAAFKSCSSDPTASSSRSGHGSGSCGVDPASLHRPRFSAPSSNIFLGPAFNSCATSASSNSSSPFDVDGCLLRYTRSGLDLSSSLPDSGQKQQLHHLLRSSMSSPSLGPDSSVMGNPHVGAARTPPVYKAKQVKVEVEEDVLVMDGVLVGQRQWARPTRGRSSSTTPGELGSGVLSSGYSVGSNNPLKVFIPEMCRSLLETGVCEYGWNCQFAHAEGEMRAARHCKYKSERAKWVPSAGSAVQDNRILPYLSPVGSETSGGPTRPPLSPLPPPPPPPAAINTVSSPTKLPSPEKCSASSVNWRPSSLNNLSRPFQWPPTREEEQFISQVLYAGPCYRQRLPVFKEICPD